VNADAATGPGIRVLLADDHAVMRTGFRMILEAAGDITVVAEAENGAAALERARSLRPDVICMDVQMPVLDGLEATRRIVADPDLAAAVLIVTTFDRDDYLFQALAAGASGFLLKNAGPEDLVAAVRVVASGDALLAPEVTRRVIARFAGGAAHASSEGAPGGGAPPFTEREVEVLRLLAQALSNAEIAAQLVIGEATVKTHVSNVLQKLGARDRVAAVVWAHRNGFA
jgi:DNA-binding NarL/FixJ family response regulator